MIKIVPERSYTHILVNKKLYYRWKKYCTDNFWTVKGTTARILEQHLKDNGYEEE